MKNHTNTCWWAYLRLNTWFELAEDTTWKSKSLFPNLTWLSLHSIRNCPFRKPEETFFFYTSRPNWTQEIAADSSAISQAWLTTNMRRSKRIHNSAGAAAQPCLMQNYHKALVLFSKAQQLGLPVQCIFQFTGEGTEANSRVCGWM